MTRYRNKYRVASARLKGWDYTSPGCYFITICTANRGCHFGRVSDGEMKLSGMGKIAEKCWREIPAHFPHTELDEFMVMPNHVHGIVVVTENGDAVGGGGPGGGCGGPGGCRDVACNVSTIAPGWYTPERDTMTERDGLRGISPKTGSLSTIVRSYKSACTKMINQINDDIFFAWQPRFYDHIVRDQRSLSRIRKYITENPVKWETDRNNHEYLYM